MAYLQERRMFFLVICWFRACFWWRQLLYKQGLDLLKVKSPVRILNQWCSTNRVDLFPIEIQNLHIDLCGTSANWLFFLPLTSAFSLSSSSSESTFFANVKYRENLEIRHKQHTKASWLCARPVFCLMSALAELTLFGTMKCSILLRIWKRNSIACFCVSFNTLGVKVMGWSYQLNSGLLNYNCILLTLS